jgi:outer membrane protein OmpA-like peptidoglycan-associated protein
MFLRSQHCKLSVALTLGMSLAACTSMIEQPEMADVTDEAFGRQLHAEYLELARAEKAEYDTSDANASTAAASTAAAAPAPATMRAASYTVYFRFDSDRLSDKAKAIVSKAGKEASAMTVDKIVIDGYADRAGGEDYNVKLSGRRADRVAGWLVGLVPASLRSKISTRLHGEDNLAVQTSDGTRNAANRRAVIHINP